MKSNEQLQKEVMDALKWEPQLDAAEIGVIVHDGIVTLAGTVDNYTKKVAAESATKKVAGVKAIVEDIQVNYPFMGIKTDEEVAKDVLKALNNNWNLPLNGIKVEIDDGQVTLEGDVNWNYQKEAAKHAIENIPGIKGINNNVRIVPILKNILDKESIKRALKRHWSINADDIDIEIVGNKVILSGKVTSLYQKEEAGKIAWKTPGVWSVENNLVVDYNYEFVS